jgi:hypothetical protein
MKTLKQIQISVEIWKKAKMYCAENSITLKQFVEGLISNKLKDENL